MEYDRATGSAVDRGLQRLIQRAGPIAVTEPVVMELAAGARSAAREAQIRRMLARFHLLPFDSVVDFDGAVAIYRECRAVGVTPRGLIDCMIASVALRNEAELMAQDVDLERVAEVMGIDMFRA